MARASLFDLSGRRALVTGSSQGLGLAIARALGQAGAALVLNGRDPAKVERVADQLAGEGLSVEAWCFDVTDEIAVGAALRGMTASGGAIDVLVNNAGVQHRAPLEEVKFADWKRVLDIHMNGAFLVTQATVRGMIERRQGKIINMISLAAEIARPTIAPYAAAKGGLKMLTRAMAVEWAKHNIQVNGIAPGYFATPLNTDIRARPEFDAWVKARTPAGRWAEPEELAGTAVYLASKASDFVTGHIVTVDGGLSAAV